MVTLKRKWARGYQDITFIPRTSNVSTSVSREGRKTVLYVRVDIPDEPEKSKTGKSKILGSTRGPVMVDLNEAIGLASLNLNLYQKV